VEGALGVKKATGLRPPRFDFGVVNSLSLWKVEAAPCKALGVTLPRRRGVTASRRSGLEADRRAAAIETAVAIETVAIETGQW